MELQDLILQNNHVIFQESEIFIKAIANYLINIHKLNLNIIPRIKNNIIVGYDLYTDTKSGLQFYNWLYRHNLDIKIESKFIRQF